MLRTVLTAVYTPAKERTDGNEFVSGDVTVIRFADCDHAQLGAPHVHYTPGELLRCNQCTKEERNER